MKNIITAEQSLQYLVKTYDILQEKVKEQGFVLNFEHSGELPYFNEKTQCGEGTLSVCLDNLKIDIFIRKNLTQKFAMLGLFVDSNKKIVEDGKILNEIKSFIEILNVYSSKQFTNEDIIDLFKNDKNKRKCENNIIEHRVKYFNFSCDIEFIFFHYQNFDSEVYLTPEYHFIVHTKTDNVF